MKQDKRFEEMMDNRIRLYVRQKAITIGAAIFIAGILIYFDVVRIVWKWLGG